MQRNAADYDQQRRSARHHISDAGRADTMFGKGKGDSWALSCYEKAIAEFDQIPLRARTDQDHQDYLQTNWDALYAAESHIAVCKNKWHEKHYQQSLQETINKPRQFAHQILRYFRRIPTLMDINTCLMLTCSNITLAGDDMKADAFSYFLREARSMLAKNFNDRTGNDVYEALSQKQLRDLTWCLCRIGDKLHMFGDVQAATDYYSCAVDVYSRADLGLECSYGWYFPSLNSDVAKSIGQKLVTLYARTEVHNYYSRRGLDQKRLSFEGTFEAMLEYAALGPPGHDAGRVLFICAAIDHLRQKPVASWSQDEVRKVMKAYDTAIYYLLDLSSSLNIFPISLNEKKSYYQRAEQLTHEAIALYQQNLHLDDVNFILDIAKIMLRFTSENLKFQANGDAGKELNISIQELMFSGTHYSDISGGRFNLADFREGFAARYLHVVKIIDDMLLRHGGEPGRQALSNAQLRNLAYVCHLLGQGFTAIDDAKLASHYYQREIETFKQLSSYGHDDCGILSRAYRALENLTHDNSSVKELFKLAKNIFDVSCLIPTVGFEDLESVHQAMQQQFTSGDMTNYLEYMKFLDLLKPILDKIIHKNYFILSNHKFLKQMWKDSYEERFNAIYKEIDSYRIRKASLQQTLTIVPASRDGMFGKRGRDEELHEKDDEVNIKDPAALKIQKM